MTTRRAYLSSVIGASMAALGAKLLGLGSLAPALHAQQTQANPKPAGKPLNKAALSEVVKAAADCIRTGDACLAHCARELRAGNKEMANCNERVQDVIAMCSALLKLASAESEYAVRLATVCADVCKSCKDACAEHQDHFAHGMHLECKACMESCQACETACRKLVAA